MVTATVTGCSPSTEIRSRIEHLVQSTKPTTKNLSKPFDVKQDHRSIWNVDDTVSRLVLRRLDFCREEVG